MSVLEAPLDAIWPPLDLPIAPPYPPMEARLVPALPAAGVWQYEPKWDGLRCLAFKAGATVALQSTGGQALGRYFPEVEAAIALLPQARLVLDGEIVVPSPSGYSFEALLRRIQPAESRVRRLAAEVPAFFFASDLLVNGLGRAMVASPIENRRAALELEAVRFAGRIHVSSATRERDEGEGWLADAAGLDGVVAKRLGEPYRAGDCSAMVKVKRERIVN
jgi:ATP-dependent DNA ligase